VRTANREADALAHRIASVPQNQLMMHGEGLARAFALTPEQVDASPSRARPPSRTAIDAELAKFAQLRRSDPRAYWKDAGRLRKAISLSRRAGSRRHHQRAAHREFNVGLDKRQIDKELAELDRLYREDPKRYWSADVHQRELELVEARERANEVARHSGRHLDDVSDATGCDVSFNALPEQARVAIRQVLALAPREPGATCDRSGI